MKYLRKYNESTESKKLLSVEEIEDYFLEFIDDKSMEFYYSGIPISLDRNKVVETVFKLNIRDMTTIEQLTNFSKLIDRISSVVKRWDLDFKFSTIAIGNKPGGGGPKQTQLSIIQPVPKIIIDNFYYNPNRDRVDLGGLIVRYKKHISVDNNSDFILHVSIETWRGGSGQNGIWLKSDYNKFKQSESEFIKHFTDNKDIPCEFINKKAASDMIYGQPFYSYFYFKVLV